MNQPGFHGSRHVWVLLPLRKLGCGFYASTKIASKNPLISSMPSDHLELQ